MEEFLQNITLEPMRPRRRKNVHDQIKDIYLKQSKTDQQISLLHQKLDGISASFKEGFNDLTRLIEDTKNHTLVPVAGANLDTTAVSSRSRATSGQTSAASSRPGSPGQLTEGIYPLLKNIAYSNKVLLKGKHEKYSEALAELRKQIPYKDAILDRVKKDAKSTVYETTSEVSKMLPLAMGLVPHKPRKSYVFTVVPEASKIVSLGAVVRKELRKEFSKVSDSCNTLRLIIGTIHSRYNGELSASQLKDAIISMCQGEFRDTISGYLDRMEINEAIDSIIQLYCDSMDISQKSAEFSKSRIDFRNPVKSLKQILELAFDCFPTCSLTEVTNIAMGQALAHLPSHVIEAVSDSKARLSELRAINPSVPQMSYPAFIDIVAKNLGKDTRSEPVNYMTSPNSSQSLNSHSDINSFEAEDDNSDSSESEEDHDDQSSHGSSYDEYDYETDYGAVLNQTKQ